MQLQIKQPEILEQRALEEEAAAAVFLHRPVLMEAAATAAQAS